MNRKLRSAALLLAGPAVLSLGVAVAGPASAVSAGPAAACSLSTPIQIDGFAFAPATVSPGESSTADLITTNCSPGTLTTQEEWTGEWISASGTGVAAGCPVIDPLLRDVTYGPGQQLAENTGYEVPVGCTAVELAVTVNISIPTSSATTIATATTYLHITQIVPAG